MRYLGLHILVIRSVLASLSFGRDYIDPGTGSMLLQVILGGVAGAAVAVKMFWHRIMAFMPSRSSGSDNSSGADQ